MAEGQDMGIQGFCENRGEPDARCSVQQLPVGSGDGELVEEQNICISSIVGQVKWEVEEEDTRKPTQGVAQKLI